MNIPEPNRLADLTIEALERTAFVLADPAESTPNLSDLSSRAIGARIKYAGEENGEFFLFASEGFVIELASGLLGVEPEEVDLSVHGDDALRELSNILGGSLILELGAEQRPISLGLPERCDPRTHRPSPEDTSTVVESIGEPLFIIWRPAQAASEAA